MVSPLPSQRTSPRASGIDSPLARNRWDADADDEKLINFANRIHDFEISMRIVKPAL